MCQAQTASGLDSNPPIGMKNLNIFNELRLPLHHAGPNDAQWLWKATQHFYGTSLTASVLGTI
jgi:hypothetical protein